MNNTMIKEPRIEQISEKKLVGTHVRMNLANNQTFTLWRALMPRRREITNAVNTQLISMDVYDASFDFRNFNAESMFDKWAAIEVTDFNEVPEGLETFVLPAGLYAVFIHYGPASEGPKTYNHIFNNWLPASDFTLDNRPHFAVMGEKYKGDSADSEEEIWIPVKPQ